MTWMKEFFEGRSVLVTGHTGFKGSWLTIWLHRLGAHITGYALAPDTQPSLFELAEISKLCDSHEGDIRDRDHLDSVFSSSRPEIVFHLAAQPLVRRSYRQPRETFDINVMGTINVLEAVRKTETVKAAVLITTDKVYENREWVYGYREVDPLGGHDPYSASKAAAEIAIASYRKAFFANQRVGIASVRAGNVVGGGDWAEDRILPDAIRAARAGVPLEVRNPGSIRPWQLVLEPLAAYLALATRLWKDPSYGQAWNVGPAADDIVPVAKLVDIFFSALEVGSWKDVSAGQANEPHEAGLLKLACDKAHHVLDWSAIYDTTQAVTAAARWYRDVVFGSISARSRCDKDIEDFETAAQATGAWWAR